MRRFIAIVSAFLLAAVLTACGLTVAQWASDAGALATAAQSIVLSLPPGTEVPAVLSTGLTELQQLANQVASAPSSATAQPAATDLLTVAEETLPPMAAWLATRKDVPAALPTALGAIAALAQAIVAETEAKSSVASAEAPIVFPGIPAVPLATARAMY